MKIYRYRLDQRNRAKNYDQPKKQRRKMCTLSFLEQRPGSASIEKSFFYQNKSNFNGIKFDLSINT